MQNNTDEIIVSLQGRVGSILLNRPQALNALTYHMVREIDKVLVTWAKDPTLDAVVIEGAGDRAFCAGGDIKAAALAGMAAKKGEGDGAVAREFFREEYTMNNRIFNFPKPYISLINGIVMGGGKGVSAHGSHRIVTENVLFAMPETNIGFFPDVGGGYFLPRCPGQVGLYLALTSKRIHAADTLYMGFATHYVASSHLKDLRAAIFAAPFKIDDILQDFMSKPEDISELALHRAEIDRCFGFDRIEDIMQTLQNTQSTWAEETLTAMQGMSPTSLKMALKQIRQGRGMSFAEVMTMEYRLSQACLAGHDFYEGVRAALIDKDRNPRWNPASAAEVDDGMIEACFQPLGGQDLVL